MLALRSECSDFSGKLHLKRNNVPDLQKEIGGTLKPQIQALREELHKVEELWLSFDDKQSQNRKQAISSFEYAAEEFQEKLASLQEEEGILIDNLQQKRTTLESEYHVSLCIEY